MTLTVAIASETDDDDAEVYACLLARLLGRPVDRYKTQRQFHGWKSLRYLLDPYLTDARRQGVKHALLAIDNDGGAKRAPEHEDQHEQAAQAANEEDGCRVCWLSELLPASWSADGGNHCIVVPVQTLETWLLCIRGEPFSAPSPEQQYHRRVLKKRFFGDVLPPIEKRLALTLAEIEKTDALAILRQRRSFQHFEAQLVNWR